MDAFDLLLKAAPPFPPKKKGKDSDGGDCPTDDKDGDGTPNSLDKDPDTAGADDAKGPPSKGGEGGDADLTPEEQAALEGEGEELPPEEEGSPPEEGDEFDPGADEAAAAQGEMSDIISQLAEAEQKFYATKGQHGGGHHQTDTALEEMHKLVRKLAKKVAGRHGLEKDGSMPEPDPMAMQGDPNGGGGMPDEMQRSLSPGLHGHVLRKAAELRTTARSRFNMSIAGVAPQPQASRAPQQAPRSMTMPMQKGEPQGQAVPQVYARRGSDHLEGPTAGHMPVAKMSHPSPDAISMANYVGDPNGGAMLNWGSIMAGRMGTKPAEAGVDGHPSQIIEQDGSVVTTGHGSVPNAAGITGQSPYAGSAAGGSGGPTPVSMPGAAPLSPPAAKMGAGSWIDWSAPSDPRGGMPFAGQINTMMVGKQTAPNLMPGQSIRQAATTIRDRHARTASQASERRQQLPKRVHGGGTPHGEMHGKATLLAHQRARAPNLPRSHSAYGGRGFEPTNPMGVSTPSRARRVAVRQHNQPKRIHGGGVSRGKLVAPMAGKQQRRGVQLTPGRVDSGPVYQGVTRAGPKRVMGGGTGKPVAKMTSPVPSAPGVPMHQTTPLTAYMAEHESAGLSGFDYAMIGRMQRMDAGYPGLDILNGGGPSEAKPTMHKAEVSFEFLLDMNDDFLRKAEEVLAILED